MAAPTIDTLRYPELRASELFQRFQASQAYSRTFAAQLIAVGRGEHNDPWHVRELAALMLQVLLLTLETSDVGEFDWVFDSLGIKKAGKKKLPASILKEGYSTRKVPGFIREFRRRLKRPRSVIRPWISTAMTNKDAEGFVEQSRQVCKVLIARYMFSPDEVVARVSQQIIVSQGAPVGDDEGLTLADNDPALSMLPDYEAEILRKLRADGPIFWVADETPSRLNALVEYPLGTVVLVVKPPGSHYEFQLKRAGRRGPHPLSARSHVPPSHRLDGLSMLSALQWDARNVTRFEAVFRSVHKRSAPVARIVQVVGTNDVPLPGGNRPILEYLTDPQVYGAGYDEMREAMAIVVDCFREEKGSQIQRIPGNFGLTMQFMSLTCPAQAILCGGSSFRLDLVARYLSADGPDEYFTNGLQIKWDRSQAKRFADDLLDEALGKYRPPDIEYEDHDQYVDAVLSTPRIRERADATYCDLLAQVGTVWGTLLGVRGYSFGESFVARNVGLRTVWSGGRWRVRLIFHDHDNLVVPDKAQADYRPGNCLGPTEQDNVCIVGYNDFPGLKIEVNSLQAIYRVDEGAREKGRRRFEKALKRAYRRTQKAMASDANLQSRFHKTFIENLRDWDDVARKYLSCDGSSNGKGWRPRVKKLLNKRGYSENLVEEYCNAIEKHGRFLRDYSFLYQD